MSVAWRVPDGFTLSVYDQLESTNTFLLSLAQNGEAAGKVILARRQSAGRGRQGRSFYSEGGLYFSFLLRNSSPEELSLITLRTAVAVYRALVPYAKDSLSIKWVNDIYLDGKKLCGILAESRFENNLSYTAVGVGINLAPLPHGTDRDFSHPAASLFDAQSETAAADILYHILKEFQHIEPDFLSFYKKNCNTLGKEISLRRGDEVLVGKAVDIAPDGALVIKQNGRILSLSSGEVTTQI